MTAQGRTRMTPERRRDHLLEAAGQYITAHGLDFSMDDIARRIGISPPLMRHYFGNRDGLLDALIRQGVEQLIVLLSDAHGAGLEAQLDEYAGFVAERPWAHRLWMAATVRDDTLTPVVSTARRRLQELAFEKPWDRMDADERFRSSVWIAAVERSIDEWLFDQSLPRREVIARLTDIAARLGIPTADGRR